MFFIFIYQFIHIIAQDELCFKLQQHLCVNGQVADIDVIPLDTVIGMWKFEKNNLDDSDNLNHFMEKCMLGPGKGASGNSGYYNGESYSEIPHIDAYDNIVTISMWIYPLSSQSQFTTILRKASKETDYTPTILLWPYSDEANVGGGQIECIVSTSYDKESLRSKSSLAGRKWNHLTVVIQVLNIQLYINGNMDANLNLNARPIPNEGPIYIGGDPWFSGTLMYIDDIVFYNNAFIQLEITKIAVLPGQINNRLFYLGCDGCNYHQSINSCRSQYHLCSLSEITAGIYQYARQQGWLRLTREIWARVDEIDEQLAKNYLDPQVSKAAICCLDTFY